MFERSRLARGEPHDGAARVLVIQDGARLHYAVPLAVMAGFIRNVHPDLCTAAQAEGLWTVADQMIAPYAVELAEELKQRERFPAWIAPWTAADSGVRDG